MTNLVPRVLSYPVRREPWHDNKIAPQGNFNPIAANILDMLCIFVHAINYFSVVLRIIFLMCIKNYFLIGPRIIFRRIANLFWGLQCIAGLAFEVDWFESLTPLGDHFENFASGGVLSRRMPRRKIGRERNDRGFHLSYKICQELVVCR